MEQLPLEILGDIILYLSSPDLLKFCKVSPIFVSLINYLKIVLNFTDSEISNKNLRILSRFHYKFM